MPEEKKVETTTTKKKVDDKVEEVKTEEKVEATETETVIDKVDYKAKYEEMREASKKAFEERKEKRENKGEVEEEVLDEEKPATKKDLEEFAEKQNQIFEEKMSASKVQSLISDSTGSEDEANLVKEILNSTTFPAGYSLEQRVGGAVALANSDKIVGENNELKRALKSKDGVSTDTSNATSKGQKNIAKSHIDPEIETVLKQSGMTFNDTSRRYERKLENGKTLFYDEKLKKQFLA